MLHLYYPSEMSWADSKSLTEAHHWSEIEHNGMGISFLYCFLPSVSTQQMGIPVSSKSWQMLLTLSCKSISKSSQSITGAFFKKKKDSGQATEIKACQLHQPN